MRVEKIESFDAAVVYFPDSMRFFRTTNSIADAIIEISKDKRFEYINNKYPHIDEHGYELIMKYLNEKASILENQYQSKSLGRLTINISNKCNMKCKYCYADGGSYRTKESSMSIDTLEKTLNVFYSKFDTINSIQLFGGEPTLNITAIKFICNYIQKNRHKTVIAIVTNGTLINDEFIDLVKENNIKVTVSIDCKEIHDELRPYESGNETYSIIKDNIIRLRRESGQPNQLEVTYTKAHEAQGITIKELILSLKRDLGYAPTHIAAVCTDDEKYKLLNVDSFKTSIDDYFEGLGSDNEFSYSFVDRFLYPLKDKSISTGYCGAGVGTLSVSSKGEIYPCFYFIDNKDLKIGDISDELLKLSKNIDINRERYFNYERNNTDKCKKCFANTVCFGCLGSNYSETGNLFEASSFHCELVKENLIKTIENIMKYTNTLVNT